GRLEAERVVGAGEVVVDRLGNPDHIDAVVRQALGDAERVLAADRDQAVEAMLLERRAHVLESAFLLVGIRARGAEDGAAAVEDPARGLVREVDRIARHDAGPAVAEADELVVVGVEALADHSADDSVEAGAVAAAGEESVASHGRGTLSSKRPG